MAVSVSETEAKLSHENARLQIFDSFLGFVSSSSIVELEKFVAVLPALLEHAKQGQYSPELLLAYVFKTLTGHTAEMFKCRSCGARFSADMPANIHGYRCPRCGSYNIMTDQEGLQILKEALAKLKPKVIVVEPVGKPLEESNSGSGSKSGGQYHPDETR